MKVLLIAGGWSTEREVSLSAVPALKSALEKLGHTVEFLDLKDGFDSLVERARRSDFAFINLHGAPGEDGLVQAMLETAGCPYNGAGPAASFRSLNKACAKQIFRDAGIPTADWVFLSDMPAADWAPSFGWPAFVKSNVGGSSLRMGLAHDRAEFDAVAGAILAAGDTVIVEPSLRGRDITCAVLGDTTLPPILILPQKGEFFTFESKYQDGGAREICPAPVDEDVVARLSDYTLRAAKALGIEGWGRADFILGDDSSLHILEMNTLPGMTSASLVPKAAAAVGMDFAALVGRIVETGLAARRNGG